MPMDQIATLGIPQFALLRNRLLNLIGIIRIQANSVIISNIGVQVMFRHQDQTGKRPQPSTAPPKNVAMTLPAALAWHVSNTCGLTKVKASPPKGAGASWCVLSRRGPCLMVGRFSGSVIRTRRTWRRMSCEITT